MSRGTNIIIGLDESKIMAECRKIIDGQGKQGSIPEYWDGQAASRIAAILVNKLATKAPRH